MKIKSLGDFLATALIVFWVISGHASYAAEPKPVNICFEEWPPFISTTENGEIEGLIVPSLKQLESHLSMDINLVSLPYVRCLKGIASGSYDAILMDDNSEGLLTSKYLTAYWELSLLTRKGEFKDTEEFVSRESGKVIFSFEYTYPASVENMFKGRRENGNTTAESIESWLSHQRVDAVLEDTSWLKALGDENQWEDYEILEPPVHFIYQYLHIHPRRKDFFDEVNVIVDQEKLDEEVLKLF